MLKLLSAEVPFDVDWSIPIAEIIENFIKRRNLWPHDRMTNLRRRKNIEVGVLFGSKSIRVYQNFELVSN